MFISHKSNVLQVVHEVEWDCRRKTKGQSKPEYWADRKGTYKTRPGESNIIFKHQTV